MILVDAHVHIYDCFDLEKFFDSAYSNFKNEAVRLGHGSQFTGILLLAETSKDNWFQHLSEYADGKDLPDGRTTGEWKFYHTDENCSLFAKSKNCQNLFIIGGRQINTSEGLEVLALISSDIYEDRISIKKAVKKVYEKGSIPVLPWGVGKWFGKRGGILDNFLRTRNGPSVFLGDNSGRPFFWPRPQLFKKAEDSGMHILPGSDPLPITGGYRRVGSFGFILEAQIPDQSLSKLLIAELMQRSRHLHTYGNLEGLYSFIRNQIALRFKAC